jgi:hypothetical protein
MATELSSLPTELRFEILQHLIQHPDEIQVSNFVTDRIAYKLWFRRRVCALTYVSQQCRIDALAVLASSNRFEVTGGLSLMHLLNTLGAIGRANLIHLNLVFPAAIGRVDARELTRAIPILRDDCPKLKLTLSLHATYLKRLSGPHDVFNRMSRRVDHVSETDGAALLKELVVLKEVKILWLDETSEPKLVLFRREAEAWLLGGETA